VDGSAVRIAEYCRVTTGETARVISVPVGRRLRDLSGRLAVLSVGLLLFWGGMTETKTGGMGEGGLLQAEAICTWTVYGVSVCRCYRAKPRCGHLTAVLLHQKP
jgi:hypothetical protein